MADERLHLNEGAYHPFYAAQHLGRYQLLRNSCVGKRVLDVACGEGYGSYLMAEWGADKVVAVDISAEAIENAKKLFSRENVRFLRHDAETIDTLLDEEAQFDILACFETIEHLPHPEVFLSRVKRLMRPGALLLISCPNDKAEFAHPGDNPYHLASYTFEEFRELTNKHLGPAKQWMIGTPVEGMVNIDISDPRSLKADASLKDITNPAPVATSSLLPGQAHVLATTESCLYYVGVWGDDLPAAAALAPLSYKGFIEPWQLIDTLRRETEEIQQRSEAANSAAASRVANLQAQLDSYRVRLDDALSENDMLRRETEEIRQRSEAANSAAASRVANLQAQLDSYRVRLDDALSKNHELRTRDRRHFAELQEQIERMTEQSHHDRQAAITAQADLDRLHGSRVQRLARAYYRLYDNRLIAPFLRRLRRLISALLGLA